MSKKYYIGIASTFHDPSLAIIDQHGEILFAESTERHLQSKRAMGCAADPIVWSEKILKRYCDLNGEFHIATTWSKAYTRTLNVLNSVGIFNKVPEGFSKIIFNKIFKSMLPDSNLIWFLKKQLASNTHAGVSLERNLRWNHSNDKIFRYQFNHHTTHASHAAYSSGFDDAVCLMVDGIGEMGSISYYEYKGNRIKQLGHHKGFESLGFFYTLITHLCGFDAVEGEEWKVMGMAPYGEKDDTFYDLLNSILVIKDCNVKFKNDPKNVLIVLNKIEQILASSHNSFEQRANLAFTGQLLFSEFMEQLLKNLYSKKISENLVYAGGCALNSSFNGKIVSCSGFRNLYVPSAPADDGTSVGAAYLAYFKNNPSAIPSKGTIQSPYLGSEISDNEIEQFIKHSGHHNIQHCPGTVHLETAKLLAEGNLVGWAQGRAEFGPRALGNRSILADPRSESMKDKINSLVKFREEFRPFAPSILEEFGEEYFEDYQPSPYMERTLRFKAEKMNKVPAVVHVDGTGRLQTVRKDLNEKYYLLIKAFFEITGVPLVLNTSFNVMGKPIINSFNDALNVFFNSGLEVLVINDYIIKK